MLGLPVLFFLSGGLRSLMRGAPVDRAAFTDARLLTTLAGEVVIAAVLVLWLARRGWFAADELGRPRARDVALGAALWVATFAIGRGASWALSLVAPDFVGAARASPIEGVLSWWAALAALAINPLFEEGLWLGYGVSTLRQSLGLWAAALASIALRVLVHYNQGPHAVISVLPVAIVFTYYYVRTGRFWPIVVAHIIINAFGFADLVATTRS